MSYVHGNGVAGVARTGRVGKNQSLWDYSLNDERVTINLGAIIHSAAAHTLWHTGRQASCSRRKKEKATRGKKNI